jgi:hypothetical protein
VRLCKLDGPSRNLFPNNNNDDDNNNNNNNNDNERSLTATAATTMTTSWWRQANHESCLQRWQTGLFSSGMSPGASAVS